MAHKALQDLASAHLSKRLFVLFLHSGHSCISEFLLSSLKYLTLAVTSL